MPRWGVSWGSRLFRVGQSPSGRWWGYFNFMGFRFFRYLDDNGNKRWSKNPQTGQVGNSAPTQSTAQSTGKAPDWLSQTSEMTTGDSLERSNDSIIESIKEELEN